MSQWTDWVVVAEDYVPYNAHSFLSSSMVMNGSSMRLIA
jgi:hypothetical protein